MPQCIDCSAEFAIEEDEIAFQKQMEVPPPKCCPHCRFLRRLVERNARNLHRRKCELTGKSFLSPYSDVPFPVYYADDWFEDGWDELSYGKDIDWNRPFFDQLEELWNAVPRMGQFICPGTLENCEYTNCIGYSKDCYITAEADYNEKVYYSNRVFHNLSVVDCSTLYNSELCYECINSVKCHSCRYCIDCENCSDSFFLKNCIGCRDCIGCMNMRQKQYCIFNEQLTKEEYEKRKEEMNVHGYSGVAALRKQVTDFWLTQPHRYVQMEQTQNSTGDHLYDSKNAHFCVDCKDLEDCKYCSRVFSVKSAMDFTSWGDRSEKIYFTASCGDNCYNLRFCTTCTTNNSDLTYCGHTTGCKHCFGCVGTRKKEYCILNKQYSKEEYETLRDKLIEHMKSTDEWGEFLPKSFCQFGYNETIAAEYFPLTKEEALSKGYKWKDVTDEVMQVDKVIDASRLPDRIADIPDDVLNWAITCKVSKRPFRIIKQELEFYRHLNVPLPHLHPDERHKNRMALMPSRNFYDRPCSKCQKQVLSVFSPEGKEIVYCEECYLQAVY